jgi:hypothetical protein
MKRKGGRDGKPSRSRSGDVLRRGQRTQEGIGPEGGFEPPEGYGPPSRSKVLKSRRRSRPSRPQRRRQGEPETTRGQRPGNGCGRSGGEKPCRVNPWAAPVFGPAASAGSKPVRGSKP